MTIDLEDLEYGFPREILETASDNRLSVAERHIIDGAAYDLDKSRLSQRGVLTLEGYGYWGEVIDALHRIARNGR